MGIVVIQLLLEFYHILLFMSFKTYNFGQISITILFFQKNKFYVLQNQMHIGNVF